MTDRPPRPARLRTRGRQFWDATTAKYDLTPGEVQLLAEVCRTLDESESLSRALAADGVTVAGSKGQTRVHPALGELRAARVVLSRLLAQLQLPDDDGQMIPSARTLRARKAVGQRWTNDRAVFGGGGDGAA